MSFLDTPIYGKLLDLLGGLSRTEFFQRLVDLWNRRDDILLSRRDDDVTISDDRDIIVARGGDDTVAVTGSVDRAYLGSGDDVLDVSGHVGWASGGRGRDTAAFDRNAGAFDIRVDGRTVTLLDGFTGEETKLRGFETFEFGDRTLSLDAMRDMFGPEAEVPAILVGGGTQTVTVNDVDPTVSVVWDRAAQQAVIETGPGPTIASRAYAMTHTAMYDAWSAYDPTATHVAIDAEGDNVETTGTEAEIEAAMSFAAYTVLSELFPAQQALFRNVMEDRYGLDPDAAGTLAARIGIDAAEDMLALRAADGSQAVSDYVPVNPSPLERVDIARWTPENVPIDPQDGTPEQSFLTPQWGGVTGFALPRTAGAQDLTSVLPPPPKAMFTEAFAGSALDFAARTITLSADLTLGGETFAAGSAVDVSKALIGPVIAADFIAQAQRVVDQSAVLTDEQKIIAEFWEDGGGTAFPPGTFMSFAQFVSARDGHTLADDAKMFLAMGNAVMDAGIASWGAKVTFDYARPVRLIRDLGELGLIGEMGIDELTGEQGFVIEAFGGFDPATGQGLGTRTILAENFVTYQRPEADPSPPFAEYTSGHSAFSGAGAEVLRRITGSDAFGGSVDFEAGTAQFESGVPNADLTLAWDTFTAAADEAGFSRLYGGIHFDDGDLNGRDLGRTVGGAAYEKAMTFIDGSATDADRPFADDFLFG